ncbi:MAG: hypothetical protein O7I93_01875 [Gemmatimonadetes bacterium]|nr:hypothetical protein [Gemmatimonadota bacterium]
MPVAVSRLDQRAMGHIGYRFGDSARPGLYVYGGAGVLSHQFRSESTPAFEASQTQFAYTGAAGVDIPLGRATLWFEARYMGGDTQFVPIYAGFSIGGG